MGPKADVFEFKGAAVWSNTIIATAIAEVITAGQDYDTVQLECTGHGYLAGSLIYLSGFIAPLKYLNGLKLINAVATNTFDVRLKPGTYVAGTPAGTEVARVAITLDEDYEMELFQYHLSAAGGTSENVLVTKDAKSGSQFDVKLYDYDVETITDDIYKLDPAEDCNANDLIVATYANTNSKTWGVKFKARRKA